ncbi:MAG: hypothetical protein ACYS0K_13795 [Planctomycetota bacterium]
MGEERGEVEDHPEDAEVGIEAIVVGVGRILVDTALLEQLHDPIEGHETQGLDEQAEDGGGEREQQ